MGFLLKKLFSDGAKDIAKGPAHAIKSDDIKSAFKSGKTYKGDDAIHASDLASLKTELTAGNLKGITSEKIVDAKDALKTEISSNITKMKDLAHDSDEYKKLNLANTELKTRDSELDHLHDKRTGLMGKGVEMAKNNPGAIAMNGLFIAPSLFSHSSSADTAAAAGSAADLGNSGGYPAYGQVPEAYGSAAVSAAQMPGVTLPSSSGLSAPVVSPAVASAMTPAAMTDLGISVAPQMGASESLSNLIRPTL